MNRLILHIDIDAFFASVEIADNKIYKNKPLIVGSDSMRGIVTTCNYEARKFGIHSAMPIYMAKNLCTNVIIVKPRHHRYKEVSGQIFTLLKNMVQKIEQVSIDEAYIDISDKNIDPIKFAMEIKRQIKSNFNITASIGISFNKFLAKIASDMNKPNGIMYITKENFKDILSNLDISKVHGLGEKSTEILKNIGIKKVGQMYDLSKSFYTKNFGKNGEEIYFRIRGIDNREVLDLTHKKSYGKEKTFSRDLISKEEIFLNLKSFAMEINTYLISNNIYTKTLTLKIKTNDFKTITKNKTYSSYIKGEEQIYIEAIQMFNYVNIAKPIRLLGLSISNFDEEENKQLSLF
ncbi:MAG: DNA polymerase IV [Sarcina sp.]